MPDNDKPLFDYHEHHGTGHNITHEHDDHPRHHHDKYGSVHYLDDVDDRYYVVRPSVVDVDHGGTDAAPIGSGGYDITHRTPRTD